MAVIKCVGIGGAGVNAVNRMIEAGIRGVEFIAINTDRQSLDATEADVRIPVGLELTRGRGTGGNAALGEQAMRESEEHIRRALRGADLVFIAAGEGGGTGTGGAPVVAKLAREMGALTIAVVTKPFAFEGSRRQSMADTGIAALRDQADTIIVIQNDRLMSVLDRGVSMVDAFRVCDDLLRQGVQGITDMITLPGLINLDFADVRTVIRGAGSALLGIGYASGANRAEEAALAAISSPLLETPIDGARGILLGVTGGPDLSLSEINRAARVVADAVGPRGEHHLRCDGRPGARRQGVGHRRRRRLHRSARGRGPPTRAGSHATFAQPRPLPSRPHPRRRRRPRLRAGGGALPEDAPLDPPEPPDLSALVRRRPSDAGTKLFDSPYPSSPPPGERGDDGVSRFGRAGRGRRGGPPRERSRGGRDPRVGRERGRRGLRRGVRRRRRGKPPDRSRRRRVPPRPNPGGRGRRCSTSS